MIFDLTHVILSQGELDALGEYSCSIPTAGGKSMGMKWKHDAHAYSRHWCKPCAAQSKIDGKQCDQHIVEKWTIGEFVPIETVPPFENIPDQIGIRWRIVLEIIPGKDPAV